MAKDLQNIDGKIMGLDGQVFHIDTRMNCFEDNKYFAAAVKCGHAGNGFFVPILMGIIAKDQESAIKIIKASPRVQNKSPRCILGISEISLPELELIKYINSCDGYLSFTNPPLDIRKVLSHHYAEVIMKAQRGEKLTSHEKNNLSKIKDKAIHYAEDYPNYCVLQKAFAPSLVRRRIVYPNKVNMDKLLYEYYKNSIDFLGIQNKKSDVLKYCLQIFGLENEFGVRLDQENNKIIFANQKGNVESVNILDEFKNTILTCQEYRLRDAMEKFQKQPVVASLPESNVNLNLPSAMDKFNARMSKTKQAQSAKDRERAD